MQFLKDKFDVLLVSTIFLAMLIAWTAYGFPGEMRDFVVGTFGAWLAVLGLRPRPNQNVTAETVNADTIDRATTQTGDIVSAEIYERKIENEKPNS